jgi:hypothetical protein
LLKKNKNKKNIINKIVMSTHTEFLPFKEYPSTLARYSNSDQLQAHQYKAILESELGQAYYQREFPTIGEAALGRLNANIPVRNDKVGIVVDNKPVDVYQQFWQYKQNGGTIFTDWTSAGVANLNTDISISHMPLHGNIKDKSLVLSNTNNVRNNLQNYGKEYLTTTNLLNSIAFDNGVSYESGNLSPLRTGSRVELEQIEHSNFADRENGDLYSRQIKELDVSLPIEYANNTRSHWVYINPSFIRPNKRLKVFHLQLKFGIFDLDSMKMTGESCLTENFNITPKGMNGPVDVLNDRLNFPPVSNPDYYEGVRRGNSEGVGSNMYCSANTNYVTMPKNHAYNDLDTSFQVMPGTNSVTLGTVMSPKLKDFVQNDLFEFNKKIVVMHIYLQYSNDNSIESQNILNHLERKFPAIFRDLLFKDDTTGKKVSMYEYYMSLSEDNKYKFLFNYQRNFSSINQPHPELETFINHLNIVKFSGHDINYPEHRGSVLLRELNGLLGLTMDEPIIIDSPGCFLLLPTMLSQDVFGVRENIPEHFSGTVDEINQNMAHSVMKARHNAGGHGMEFTPIVNNSPNPKDPNECITSPSNYKLNATNCAFRDSAGRWIQKQNPNFVPNMFNDPNNLNNDIYNLENPFAGANPYNAPTGF